MNRLPNRLRAKLVVDSASGCWLWQGATTRPENGYGQVRFLGRKILVHRLVYELLVGPVPEGLTLDHVAARGCTSRLCCNPDHLEPVTMRENILRGNGFAAQRARQTTCRRGHALEGDNLRINRAGSRVCRTCRRENERRRRARA
jgi:hypothetical protein